MEVVGVHLLEHLADCEHRVVWAAEAEVAALVELLEAGVVERYYLTFPALVATVGSAVVHRPAVMSDFAVGFVLA